MKRIAIIGGGSMGAAIAHCFVANAIVSKEQLQIVEVIKERAERVADDIGCSVVSMAEHLVPFDLLLLAVKPQDFEGVAVELRSIVKPSHLVISVMTGMTMARIQESLGGHAKIIRCMPNLPVLVGKGVIAYVSSAAVEAAEIPYVNALLHSCGAVVPLEREDLLNAVTAISGSGPAYLYYALEQFFTVGQELSLDPKQLEVLLYETIRGSLDLLIGQDRSLTALRSAVTSKGGTTAAAIECFENGRLGEVLKDAVRQANHRAIELSKI